MRYVHQDHLGSTSVITDDTGAAVYEATYDPWGNVRASTGTADTHRLYTGQRFDAATGLYYYNARYYDPTLARFISPDTIVPGVGNPQAWNRYAYVLGNPLRYTDPSGHCVARDEDWAGTIITTRGDMFDCTNDEIDAMGGDWALFEYWLGFAGNRPNGFYDHDGYRAIVGRLVFEGFYGALRYLSLDEFGRPSEWQNGCSILDARNVSCVAVIRFGQ